MRIPFHGYASKWYVEAMLGGLSLSSTQSQATIQSSSGKGTAWIRRTAVVWKTALGSLVSWEAALLTHSRHPYLAPLTLILCLQSTLGKSIRFAWYRTLGTFLGVLIIGFVAKDVPVGAWSLAIILFSVCAVLKVFRMNDVVIHQVALSILFVLYFEQHSDGYAFDRAKDTLIGAATAIVFMFLAPPKGVLREAQDKLLTFIEHFAASVEGLGRAVRQDDIREGRYDPISTTQGLYKELQQIHQTILEGKQTPFLLLAKGKKVHQEEGQFSQLNQAYTHFASLIDVFSGHMTLEERRAWGDRLTCTAEEIRKFPYEMTIESSLHNVKTRSEIELPSDSTKEFQSEVASVLLGSLKRNLRMQSVEVTND